VTGAAGFIGSALSRRLIDNSHEVLGIDSFSDYYSVDYKRVRLKEMLPNNFEVYKFNLQDYEILRRIFSDFRPDAVVHLAAQAGVRIPLSGMNKYVESNLIGFSNILRVVVESGISNFLYASSSSIYGDESKTPYTESELNLKPNSFYGATKLSNEIMAASVTPQSKTNATGMRFFTVYGPWGRPDMAYFRMVSNAIVRSKFDFFGDGKIKRDFTYIDDVIDAISMLIGRNFEGEAGSHSVVNIGGGNPISMLELKEIIELQTGKTLKFNSFPGNSGDVKITMASHEKLEQIIGYFPKTSLNDGISEVIKWCQNPAISTHLNEWTSSVE
jgi:UDP-glucuronate 4-epimerase